MFICLLVVNFGLSHDVSHNMLILKLRVVYERSLHENERFGCFLLSQLLGHLENTSPECLPHSGVVGMTTPAPAINQFTDIAEGRLLAAVEQQRRAEIQYHSDTFSLPW